MTTGVDRHKNLSHRKKVANSRGIWRTGWFAYFCVKRRWLRCPVADDDSYGPLEPCAADDENVPNFIAARRKYNASWVGRSRQLWNLTRSIDREKGTEPPSPPQP